MQIRHTPLNKQIKSLNSLVFELGFLNKPKSQVMKAQTKPQQSVTSQIRPKTATSLHPPAIYHLNLSKNIYNLAPGVKSYLN